MSFVSPPGNRALAWNLGRAAAVALLGAVWAAPAPARDADPREERTEERQDGRRRAVAPLPGTNVALHYAPTDKREATVRALDARVYVARVADARPTTARIGTEVRGRCPVPAYAVGTEPADFVREAVARELRRAGVDVVEDPADATHVVEVDLDRFYVTEDSRFRADVRMHLAVATPGGEVLYRTPAAGQSSTWGRTRNPENYNKVLSNATRDAVVGALRAPRIERALRG